MSFVLNVFLVQKKRLLRRFYIQQLKNISKREITNKLNFDTVLNVIEVSYSQKLSE